MDRPTLAQRIARFEHDAEVISGSFAEEGVSIIEALQARITELESEIQDYAEREAGESL